jgi:EmrB/QacA subfamily drug resistance transporter
MSQAKDNGVVSQVEHQERSHEEIMVIILALMLAMLLAALDQTIVSTALPHIARSLHGVSKYSWVATTYLMTTAISTPLYGKIGDQFGRKKILQFAIILFLIGSALCGVAQTMNQLIIFRALQGLGAGGLMSLSQAIVGDIVPPRQRGKYLGYFAGVFAISSVAGPLLGGFLTDSLSWRWVFYVNLPIGIIALFAIASRLHLPAVKRDHKIKIDLVGAGLLTASTLPLLLATIWGGVIHPWGSSLIISLLAGSLVMAILLVLWERKQPTSRAILPIHLFKSDIFTVSTILSLFAGMALFATILFIPEYQQYVRNYSAVKSGLYMLPLMVGMLISMIGSGQLIAKIGRYRIFPIIGTLLTGFGVWLYSHVSLTTPQTELSLWMLIIGLGIGMFMQIMTLAVQNSVSRDELGVATGTITFFRSIGSSLGGAIFGAILIDRLKVHLNHLLPSYSGHSSQLAKSVLSGISPSSLHKLQPNVSHAILEAFVLSFRDLFLYAIPVLVLAFIAALFLREVPLRTTTAGPEAAA